MIQFKRNLFTVWMVSKENHGVWNDGEECIPVVLMVEITEYMSETLRMPSLS